MRICDVSIVLWWSIILLFYFVSRIEYYNTIIKLSRNHDKELMWKRIWQTPAADGDAEIRITLTTNCDLIWNMLTIGAARDTRDNQELVLGIVHCSLNSMTCKHPVYLKHYLWFHRRYQNWYSSLRSLGIREIHVPVHHVLVDIVLLDRI